nr:hypothetical protein [Tanacetum cinerariifolium]
MVFMAKMEKVAYYTSESESESEYETSEYYDNSTNYGLFVNDNDDQENFHHAIESASENFIKNHIDSKKDYDKSKVDHNDSEEKDHLVDKIIRKFNHKIAKYLDTFSSVRRPKHSGVIWKKKGSSNTSNKDLSFVSHSKLNKDVKRYSRKDLLSCNNSHLGETSSAYVCNDAMNVSCNFRLYDSSDENNLFIFDDICLWIIDSGCSKHMMGNRALLTNFVEKFLGTVRFGNNDFALIAGYEDVVIGSMTIKKVYYVERLGHNLFSVGQFCDKGLEVAFRKSTSKASSSQSWLWHQRLLHLNFTTINNLVKNNLVQGLPKMKFKKDRLCSASEQGKIHQKHHKSKTAFALNKPLYLLHMDLCDPMRVESINGKRCYLLNDYDDVGKLKAKGDIGVFVGYSKESGAFRIYNKQTRKIHESMIVNIDEISKMVSKQFSLEPGLSNLNEIGKSSNPSVLQVSKTSKKDSEDLFQNFYDEYFDSSKIMKSSTTNIETSNIEIPSNEEEFFHEKQDVVPSSNTQSVSNNMVPNVDEASTSIMCLMKVWRLLTLMQFSCLLSFIEPANVAEALRDADWVRAMQEELDQFAGLKTSFLNRILKEEVMENCDTVLTPMVEQAKLKINLVGKPFNHTDYRSMIGSLMYVTSSMPDIMFATVMCARYQANPNEHHMSAVKRIFRYLKGTINLGDKLVCWLFKKQNCVSISTAESEYVAVSSCCAQVLWMRTQLTDYGFFYDKVPIYCDSNSAVAILCNSVQHTRTKHIDVRYHFIKDHVENER